MIKYGRVGLDIDGTLSSHNKVLELMADFYEKPLIDIRNVMDYNISSIYGISDKDSRDFWEKIEHIICADSEFDHARTKRIYEEFIEEGAEVYIITSRDEKYRDITETWLADHGITYEKLFMTGGGSKVGIMRDLGLNVMVDDKAELFEEVRDAGLDTTMVCVEYGYNYGAPYDILMSREGLIL